MSIQLVVFDIAGTTVNDNKDVHRVLQGAMDFHGVKISIADANTVMGIPKPVAIRELLERRYTGHKKITEDWISDIHDKFVRDMIRFYRQDGSVTEKDGATETFSILRRNGIKVFLDTGFDREITNALLERLGWIENGIIDGSVTSDEVPNGRPAPDLIFKAMTLCKVSDSNHVAKVGDTTSDLQEGRNAGCKYVIGVTSGAHSKKVLQKEYHTHLVARLEQVPLIVCEKVPA